MIPAAVADSCLFWLAIIDGLAAVFRRTFLIAADEVVAVRRSFTEAI